MPEYDPDEEAKKLMHFIERYPVVFPIMHSTLFIRVLKALRTAKDIVKLRTIFPYIEEQDIKEMLDVLISAKLAVSFKASNKEFYYISPLGKEFLELYERAKLALLKGGLEEIRLDKRDENA